MLSGIEMMATQPRNKPDMETMPVLYMILKLEAVLRALYKRTQGEQYSTCDMILADVAFIPNVYGNTGNAVPVIRAGLG